MKTRVAWLCLLALMLALVPSLALGDAGSVLGLRHVGGLLGVKEVVGVPSLIELLGAGPAAAGPPRGAALSPPRIVARREWGADESLRFRGRRRSGASFLPVRKLIVHHTATRRWEPPRRAIRRIYRAHVARGFADIAYHYLVAPDGTVFKGRYSGPPGTRQQDRPWADKRRRLAVRGAHALTANNGTVGIALLGNYDKAPLSAKARESLVRMLAWLADRYGIDPRGSSRYPASSGRTVLTKNVAGHRAYGRTICPGEAVERELPEIRRDVARRLRGAARARPDAHGPLIFDVRTPKVGRRGVLIKWMTDEPARAVVSMRAQGSSAPRTRVRRALATRHAVRIRPLRRNMAYIFRIGGADAEGNTAWSAPHSLRTKG